MYVCSVIHGFGMDSGEDQLTLSSQIPKLETKSLLTISVYRSFITKRFFSLSRKLVFRSLETISHASGLFTVNKSCAGLTENPC